LAHSEDVAFMTATLTYIFWALALIWRE